MKNSRFIYKTGLIVLPLLCLWLSPNMVFAQATPANGFDPYQASTVPLSAWVAMAAVAIVAYHLYQLHKK